MKCIHLLIPPNFKDLSGKNVNRHDANALVHVYHALELQFMPNSVALVRLHTPTHRNIDRKTVTLLTGFPI